MVEQSSSSIGKRLAYCNFNTAGWKDSIDTPLKFHTSSYTESTPSSTLEAKKKKILGHEKNPAYPPKAYGHFIKRWP
jgi:hypothetical protein